MMEVAWYSERGGRIRDKKKMKEDSGLTFPFISYCHSFHLVLGKSEKVHPFREASYLQYTLDFSLHRNC